MRGGELVVPGPRLKCSLDEYWNNRRFSFYRQKSHSTARLLQFPVAGSSALGIDRHDIAVFQLAHGFAQGGNIALCTAVYRNVAHALEGFFDKQVVVKHLTSHKLDLAWRYCGKQQEVKVACVVGSDDRRANLGQILKTGYITQPSVAHNRPECQFQQTEERALPHWLFTAVAHGMLMQACRRLQK